MVFLAIGRPGIVLVAEGPKSRVRELVASERKRIARVLPNVPVHVIHAGQDADQTSLVDVSKEMKKLPKSITKLEVSAIDKRLSTLTANRLPIPKGVDPTRVRPNRRATRGR